MSVGDNSRREGLTISAVNPVDGKWYDVLISHDRLMAVAKRSKGAVAETAYIVPMVLQNPTAVFEGLCQDQDEPRGRGVGWLCYCGVPDRAYLQDGAETDPPPHEVFLVFVTDGRIACNWRWEKCDPDDPTLVAGYETRFAKRVL